MNETSSFTSWEELTILSSQVNTSVFLFPSRQTSMTWLPVRQMPETGHSCDVGNSLALSAPPCLLLQIEEVGGARRLLRSDVLRVISSSFACG